ncbi:hypothetical protein CTAYLR_000223 [Chrysophaeum taylorii]|uniref:Uncharacterized protein n=1 Tax=Chrysophaeum taylorii TaxID=2483200 RepID=A0AAD7XM63_9STRA|nr:hypothetical protein CTAYLR_000223 [Chrysophaeum taylorii]
MSLRAVLLLAAVAKVSAFLTGDLAVRPATSLHAYVPDGLTPAQWAAMKKKEADAKSKKNFGAGGARGFKSRSMQSFVAALEKGEATHLFAVDPKKVKKGEIALKDVPYMQRGGSWDNADLKGKKGWMKTGFGMTAFNDGKAEVKKRNKYDDKYNNLKPSISIFGTDIAVDWTGNGGKGDGVAARAKKNGISNDQQMWRDAGALSVEQARKRRGGPKLAGVEEEKKKFFGLF